MDSFQFEVSIAQTQDQVRVCIQCLGDVCIQQEDKCLISIMVSKNKSAHKATLTDYYHDILHNKEYAASKLSNKLQGLIYAVLCILLQQAMSSNILNPNDIVEIPLPYAAVSMDELKKIIDFYEKIGFYYDLFLGNPQVVSAKVSKLLDVCKQNQDKISAELQDIIAKSCQPTQK